MGKLSQILNIFAEMVLSMIGRARSDHATKVTGELKAILLYGLMPFFDKQKTLLHKSTLLYSKNSHIDEIITYMLLAKR